MRKRWACGWDDEGGLKKNATRIAWGVWWVVGTKLLDATDHGEEEVVEEGGE